MSKRNRSITPGNPPKPSRITPPATYTQDFPDPEMQRLRIAYEFHNDDVCECHSLKQAPATRVIGELRRIGRCTASEFDQSLSEPTRKKVYDTGHYSPLFSKVSEGIELWEYKIGHAERLFYFRERDLVQIVAIKCKHLEDKKVRRK